MSMQLVMVWLQTSVRSKELDAMSFSQFRNLPYNISLNSNTKLFECGPKATEAAVIKI